ncbi:UNVERIFIED_CONTAM: hypothetical protein BEN50_03670 [Euhalothece sp. KZN 001]
MAVGQTLEQKISERLTQTEGDVFLRKDFQDLGSYSQVGRVLHHFVIQGKLVKIGYGLYARGTTSPLSGELMPQKPLPELALKVLERLNIEVEPSSFARAYNEGRSTQVPTGRVIGVKQPISRKIGYDGKYVTFEYH